MSKDISNGSPSRVSFDPGTLDIGALDEIADRRDMSRAELIRSELQDVVAQHAEADGGASDLHMPANEELREAYERLLALSDHPLGIQRVSVDEAKGQLWTQDCPKKSVKTRLLQPLAEEGFISVRSAKIRVHRRTVAQIEEAEAEADDEMNDIEESTSTANASYNHRPEPEHLKLVKYQHAGLNVPLRFVGWVASQTLWSDQRVAADGGELHVE